VGSAPTILPLPTPSSAPSAATAVSSPALPLVLEDAAAGDDLGGAACVFASPLCFLDLSHVDRRGEEIRNAEEIIMCTRECTRVRPD
jgi:hypothetical protein